MVVLQISNGLNFFWDLWIWVTINKIFECGFKLWRFIVEMVFQNKMLKVKLIINKDQLRWGCSILGFQYNIFKNKIFLTENK